jgi:hypothetical protein
MKNNDKDALEIYNAFNSVVSPNSAVKQRIFSNVMNKEKKKVLSLRSTLIPAAAMVMVIVNVGILYTSVTGNPMLNPQNSPSPSNHSAEIPNKTSEKTYTEPSFSSSEKNSLPVVTTSLSVSFSDVDTSVSVPIVTAVKNTEQTTTPFFSAEITSAFMASEEVTTETQSTPENSGLLPPVSIELQNLYADAYEIYKQYTMGLNQYSDENIVINGEMYTKANPEYFHSIDDVSEYFHKYFTERFIQEIDIISDFTEYNGNIYCKSNAKGGIMGYAGHTYSITETTENEINIEAICYISDNSEEIIQDYFFETPENPENYYTIQRNIRFIKENGEWRVDRTALMW